MRVAGGIVWVAAIFWSVGCCLAAPLKAPSGCAPAEGTTAEPYTGSGYAREIVHGKTGIRLVFVPSGAFTMGARGGIGSGIYPLVSVKIARPFYIGKYEVTNREYIRFVEATGYDGKADSDTTYSWLLRHFRGQSMMPTGDDYPVVWVNWKHARAFCRWAGLRLPTDAEWEYACRAGTETRYYFGEDESDFDKYGWYTTNSYASTHAVGGKLPNAWGLYDMHGNVWEWCEDDYHRGSAGLPTDGTAWVTGRATRVLRGGSWSCLATVAYASGRFNSGATNASNDVGFRVVLSLD